MTLTTLISFSLASAILAFAPGPDNFFVITQSALHGRRSGFLITLGLCTGLLFHTLAVALGISALLLVSSTAFTLLKIAGAAYLGYLAWQALQQSHALAADKGNVPLSGPACYRRGILMNISNPKVAIFFLAYLPQFASPAAGPMAPQLILLGLVFTAIALLCFCLMALLADRLSALLLTSRRTRMWLNRTAALVFIALAIRLITVGS